MKSIIPKITFTLLLLLHGTCAAAQANATPGRPASGTISNETVLTRNARGALVAQVNDRILAIDGRVWTQTDWDATALLLAAVMHAFDNISDSLRSTPIHLYHSRLKAARRDTPELVERDGHTDIFLSSDGNYWCQYVYQFAHEYMHYLIEREYRTDDRFGWFEEALCELASLYVLERMEEVTFRNPRVEAYKHHFDDYARDVLATNDVQLAGTFLQQLPDYLADLERDRYDRPKNRAVAERLLPYFLDNPRLWRAIPYLRLVDGDNCVDFGEYVARWSALLPEVLRQDFNGTPLAF